AGEFREDLYFRLSVYPIRTPSLRERPEDIPSLAEHFLRQARLGNIADTRLSQEVLEELRARSWTGNVRELRNAIEHAAILARGPPIRPEHLPRPPAQPDHPSASDPAQIQALLTDWTRRAGAGSHQAAGATLYERFLQLAEPPVLRAVLQQCGQNRAAAAQIL